MPLTLILIVGLVLGQTASDVATSPQRLPTDLATLRQKAGAGDAEAQFTLGKAFENGKGVSQSDEEVARWYEKAAAKGHGAAQLELGVLLWTGRGVTKDKVQAVEWYRKAAKQGNGGAMFNLGTAYYNGEGGTRTNELQAFVWFLLAQDHASTLGAEAIQRSEKTIPADKLIDTYKQIAAMYVRGAEIPKTTSQPQSGIKRRLYGVMPLQPRTGRSCSRSECAGTGRGLRGRSGLYGNASGHARKLSPIH